MSLFKIAQDCSIILFYFMYHVLTKNIFDFYFCKNNCLTTTYVLTKACIEHVLCKQFFKEHAFIHAFVSTYLFINNYLYKNKNQKNFFP